MYIEDAYGGSSPHSYTVCVCDYSRSRGRHKCRHPRKAKSAYLQNMHICKSCVSAQPAYLQNLTENLRKIVFCHDFGGSGGLWGRPCQKDRKMYQKGTRIISVWGVHFWQLSPKSGHPKIDRFSDPAFSHQNPPRASQREHHSLSGGQKVAKMEPKMITFRGPPKKLKSGPG